MNRTFGASLLIIGTTIGGGMLALPVATAHAGFVKSSLLIIAAWFFMTIGSLLVLEVCVWLPENSNLSTMAKRTLGFPGQAVAWISYGLVLYCAMCAYTSGGADLLQQFFAGIHLHLPRWMNDLIYLLLFGSVIWHGARATDYLNRALMFIKLGSLVLLILFIAPHTQTSRITSGPTGTLLNAALIVALSFTFSMVVPSMRSYLKNNVKQTRIAIWIGSTVPLIFYLTWNYVIQSTISTQTLIHMGQTGEVVGKLTIALSNIANSPWLTSFAHLFTAICMVTTFLALSLSLSDFIADGLKLSKKKSPQKLVIYALTYLPIFIILLVNPNIFLKGLNFAGIFCVIIVMILPPLMVWRGRYHKKIAKGYAVFGGKALLAIELVLGVLLILIGLLR